MPRSLHTASCTHSYLVWTGREDTITQTQTLHGECTLSTKGTRLSEVPLSGLKESSWLCFCRVKSANYLCFSVISVSDILSRNIRDTQTDTYTDTDTQTQTHTDTHTYQNYLHNYVNLSVTISNKKCLILQ